MIDMSSYEYLRGGNPLTPTPQRSSFGLDQLLSLAAAPGRRGGGGGGVYGQGGIEELIWRAPDHYNHLHFAATGLPLKRIARKLENKFGVDVGELEGFQGEGQISGGHSPNSYHYSGNAFDVNYYGSGNESDVLDRVYRWLNRRYG